MSSSVPFVTIILAVITLAIPLHFNSFWQYLLKVVASFWTMACESYCENGKTLDATYDHGLPRCLFETVTSIVLLLLVTLACLPQLLRIVYRRRLAKNRYVSVQDNFDQSIDATATDLLLNTDTSTSGSSKFMDDPAGFLYGDNHRNSFLYTCQLFFHVCQVILPLVDLVVKGKPQNNEEKTIA